MVAASRFVKARQQPLRHRDRRSPGAGMRESAAGEDLPLYDYREALRPSTRLGPLVDGEFEEEGWVTIAAPR